MRKLTTVGAGLLLSATMLSSAMADEITMWTMEEQPDRMARQQQIADDSRRNSQTCQMPHASPQLPDESVEFTFPRWRGMVSTLSLGC